MYEPIEYTKKQLSVHKSYKTLIDVKIILSKMLKTSYRLNILITLNLIALSFN